MSDFDGMLVRAAAPLEGSESRVTKMLSKACQEVGQAFAKFHHDMEERREMERRATVEAAKPKANANATPQKSPYKIEMKPPVLKPPGAK